MALGWTAASWVDFLDELRRVIMAQKIAQMTDTATTDWALGERMPWARGCVAPTWRDLPMFVWARGIQCAPAVHKAWQ